MLAEGLCLWVDFWGWAEAEEMALRWGLTEAGEGPAAEGVLLVEVLGGILGESGYRLIATVTR